MPRDLTSANLDALPQRFEPMAGGLSRHKGEDDFPKRLDDSRHHARRDWLLAARESAKVLAKLALTADEKCSNLEASTVEKLAQGDEAARAFYDKADIVVTGSGTKMATKRGGREPGPKRSLAA